MSSSSSLVFSSLALPKTLSHPKSSLSFLSLTSSASSLKLNSARPASLFIGAAPSRLVTSVAVSSEFQQDEGVLRGGGEEPIFSPDLKLFVGNLPFNVDSSDLAALFERAGNVEMVEVIYDKLTGRSRGFGFVTMSSVQEVEAAAQQFNGYEVEGRPLRVNAGPPPKRDDSDFRGERAAPRFESGNSGFRGGRSGSFDAANRLYVGNLSWGVDNLALENLFSEQGKVVEARVVYDRDSGRSRGFGFVTYSSAEEANSAVETLNGVDLNGRSIRVTVAESKPRRDF